MNPLEVLLQEVCAKAPNLSELCQDIRGRMGAVSTQRFPNYDLVQKGIEEELPTALKKVNLHLMLDSFINKAVLYVGGLQHKSITDLYEHRLCLVQRLGTVKGAVTDCMEALHNKTPWSMASFDPNKIKAFDAVALRAQLDIIQGMLSQLPQEL